MREEYTIDKEASQRSYEKRIETKRFIQQQLTRRAVLFVPLTNFGNGNSTIFSILRRGALELVREEEP